MDQKSFFAPESDWTPPDSFPDLTKAKEIAIDLETRPITYDSWSELGL